MRFFNHNAIRYIYALFVMCLSVHHQGAFAQQNAAEENRYTFVLTAIPVDEALTLLIDRTDIELFYESAIVANKTAYCSISDGLVEDILKCILRGTDLDYYRLSSGMYIVVDRPRAEAKFGSLAGLVVDAETNEPLPDATVLLAYAETGAATNRAGRFAFSKLEPGLHPVIITHVAYEDVYDSVLVSSGNNPPVQIGMLPRTVISSPIVINGLHERMPSERLTGQQISANEVLDAPVATPSLYEAMNEVVGVRVGDALSDVHVQGGDSGEHQYLLDGVPVFVPIRNGGFFGAFSPFAFNQITVHKAGFDASHGSFLSGAIDIEHAVLSSSETLVDVQVDPLSANGRLQGGFNPTSTLQVNWMVAGRIGLWDIFQPGSIERSFREWSIPNTFVHNTLLADNGGGVFTADSSARALQVSFSDFHAATRIRLGGTRSLHLSLYQGHNAFGVDEDDLLGADETGREDYVWSNRVWQVRYEWVQGHRTFLHVGAWSSDYNLEHPVDRSPFVTAGKDKQEEDDDDFDEISEIGLRFGFDTAIGSKHTLSGSIEPVFTESGFSLSIDPTGEVGAVTNETIQPVDSRIQSYLEDAISLSDRTGLRIGSRFTYIPGQQRLYAEPRVSIRHDIPDGPGGAWALHAGAGLYRQFIYQFDVADYNATTLLPGFRFWIPIGKDLRAPSAYHLATGLLFIPSGQWQFLLEGYYKYHPYLTVLDYVGRNGVSDAKGYATGAGLSISYEVDRLRISGRYDYAVARRRISDRFDGDFVPVSWETPHQAYMSTDYTMKGGVTVTARWQAAFNRTWGFRRAYYDFLEPIPDLQSRFGVDFSRPGSHRLPAFSQLDLGIAYSRNIGQVRIQARLNVINVFDRENVVDWILEEENDILLRNDRTSTPFYTSASIRIRY